MSHWRGAAHAVAYFGVSALAIALPGARGRMVSPESERSAVAHEARLFPRSAMARCASGLAALQAGMPRPVAELAAAPDLAPTFEGPAHARGARRQEGRKGEEIEHAFAAVRSEPADSELRYALAGRLALEKRLDEAESQYREVTRLRPSFAGGYQGSALSRSGGGTWRPRCLSSKGPRRSTRTIETHGATSRARSPLSGRRGRRRTRSRTTAPVTPRTGWPLAWSVRSGRTGRR